MGNYGQFQPPRGRSFLGTARASYLLLLFKTNPLHPNSYLRKSWNKKWDPDVIQFLTKSRDPGRKQHFLKNVGLNAKDSERFKLPSPLPSSLFLVVGMRKSWYVLAWSNGEPNCCVQEPKANHVFLHYFINNLPPSPSRSPFPSLYSPQCSQM